MLRIIALNCSGLFGFGMMPTIILDNRGTIFIHGVNEDHNGSSNGSGKSAFLNCIKQIIFGENDTGKSGNNIINNHKDWKNGCFGVIWLVDKNDVFWRVLMLRKWKGSPPPDFCKPLEHLASNNSEIIKNNNEYTGTDIFLERWDGTIWVDERATSIGSKQFKDTQKKIIDVIVGMTYDQFSAYVFLGQNAESALVHGTSGGREKIIQAVADISIWDKATHVAKLTCEGRENEANILMAKISGLRSTIDLFIPPTNDQIDKLKNEIMVLNNQIQQNNINLSKLPEQVKENKDRIAAAVVSNKDLQQEIDLLRAEERHALERYTNYQDPTRPKELDEHNRKINILDASITQNANKIEKYGKLHEGDCPTCGQKIVEGHLQKEIWRLQNENVQSEREVSILRDYFMSCNTGHQKKVVEGKKAIKDAFEYESKLINKRMEEITLRQLDIIELERNLYILNNKIREIENNNGWAKNQITSIQSNLDSLHQRKTEHENLKQILVEESNKYTSLITEVQHLKWTSRNLQKMKLHEYDSAIVRLNELIAIEMSNLWGPGLTAEFITAKEKADSDGVKQEFGLIVHTPNKDSVPIEMYSGGQNKIIVIAVFRAARKLVNERGFGINIAAIDEIDKDLDDYNADALVEAFNSIADDSSSCFVISHNSRLLNTMRFDNIWTVRMKNEFSTVDVNS